MARFDIHHAMATLQAKAPDWTATALTEVARTMGRDPFKILIGCLLSLRTKDETTGPAAARLFALAGTPEAMLHLSAEQIAKAIYPVGFYRTKAASILDICRVLVERYGGQVPDTMEALTRIERGRAENRQPGADDGVPNTGHLCGYPCASHLQPLAVCADQDPGRDGICLASQAPEGLLDGLQ